MASSSKTSTKAAIAEIRNRASARMRAKTAELTASFRNRLKSANVKAQGKDLLNMALDPVLTGAAGAFALDMALKPLNIANGATADVLKAAGAIAAGYYGRKLIKHPYYAHAMIGAAIVNTHRLGTRVLNRVGAGQLAGLFDDGLGDMDLGAMPQAVTQVPVLLADGRAITAQQDSSGNFYDQAGNPLYDGRRQAASKHSDVFSRANRDGLGEIG